MKAVQSAQVIRGLQPHMSNPCWPLRGLLLKSAVLFFIIITGRAGTRQSAHSHPTTMEQVCGQGRLRLDKYATMPQKRCSYFHRFVWECKFMCVIPVYYINAPGQNENEYSHMRALAHTWLILFKVNKHKCRVFIPSLHIYSMLCCCWCNLWAEPEWARPHICNMYACCRNKTYEYLMDLNVFYTHWQKGFPF